MKVAQAAGAILQVRLQMVDGVLITAVPFKSQVSGPQGNFIPFTIKKSAESAIEFGKQRAITGKKTPIDQTERQLQIAFRQRQALRNGMNALADP